MLLNMVQKVRSLTLIKIGNVLLFFLAFSILARADEINVKATVDRNQMRPGDTFTYSISISADGSTSFDQPRLPDLSGFEIISSWSGSEMRGTFVNGQVQTQRMQNFNYMLSATLEGKFTIGAAEVVVNGKTMRTNPIQIQVSASAPQGPSLGQNPSGPQPGQDEEDGDNFEEDLFSQLLRRRMQPGNPRGGGNLADTKDSFFIHVEVDKDKVFQGEQVTASWYLVARTQIADIDTLKYPELTGFWKEDIELATRLNFRPEVIKGIQYQKALLASYALFPIKAGVAQIDPYRAKCRVIGQNMIGFPREAQIVKDSNAIPITVLPLPETGKPENFTGGVGEFTLSAKTDVTAVKANTPVTLKVRIEGRGNAKMIDFQKLNFTNQVQVYDTKSEMKFFPNGRSYKEFETLLVPKEPGELKIPPLQFAFFNPEQKKYYTQSTNEIVIQVQPGEGRGISPEQMQFADTKPSEKKLILPGILLADEKAFEFSLAQQTGAWGALFALSVLGLGLYIHRQLASREKREDLKHQIKRRMAHIESRLNRGDWRGVGVEATNLIGTVLGEVAGLGGAAFEFDKLVEKSPPSFKRDVAPQIKTLMAKLEAVGFAPEGVVGSLRQKSELKKLLADVEKLLLAAAKYDFTAAETESETA